jgi:hypothetical protein
MSDASWHLEAALVSASHVFCAGTLAQCVRKWSRLSNDDKASAFIKVGSEIVGFQIIGASEIQDYARNPELARV